MVINPEKAAALEIFRLLQYPSFLKRDSFAKGSVELVELKIKENNVLANTRLDQFRTLSNVNALVCAVERGGMVSIPKGSFSLQVGDKLTMPPTRETLSASLKTSAFIPRRHSM